MSYQFCPVANEVKSCENECMGLYRMSLGGIKSPNLVCGAEILRLFNENPDRFKGFEVEKVPQKEVFESIGEHIVQAVRTAIESIDGNLAEDIDLRERVQTPARLRLVK